MKIDFDAEAHRYRIDGVGAPSVTQVLDLLTDFSAVSADVMARARAFGHAVHRMVELYEARDLDEGTLDPALRPYLDGYLEWRSHFRPEHVLTEVRVGSKLFGYAGTLDLLAIRATRHILVDLKSGTSATVGPQTAAYKQAWEELTGDKIHERRCLTLTATGPKVKKLEDASDWSIFQSCLNIHRFKERRHAA